MGLAGSWFLFTGLIGAWLSAVCLYFAFGTDPAKDLYDQRE